MLRTEHQVRSQPRHHAWLFAVRLGLANEAREESLSSHLLQWTLQFIIVCVLHDGFLLRPLPNKVVSIDCKVHACTLMIADTYANAVVGMYRALAAGHLSERSMSVIGGLHQGHAYVGFDLLLQFFPCGT